MALQSSGQITLQDIATEFGGTAPHGLTEYYGAAAGIPASGEISIQDFYGASSIFVLTVTEGQSSKQETIVKNTYTDYLRGYAASCLEVVPPTAGTWSPASIGSRTPTTYNGATIEAACRYSSGFLNPDLSFFYFILQGNRPQNFFTSLTPQGSLNALASADATYSYNATGNFTSWSWGDAWASPQPPSVFGVGNTLNSQWDGTGTSTVTIV